MSFDESNARQQDVPDPHLPDHIRDQGLITKQNWDSYLEWDDAYLHVGYVEATEAITNRLSELLTSNLSSEQFRNSIQELVDGRRDLLVYANDKIAEDINETLGNQASSSISGQKTLKL